MIILLLYLALLSNCQRVSFNSLTKFQDLVSMRYCGAILSFGNRSHIQNMSCRIGR